MNQEQEQYTDATTVDGPEAFLSMRGIKTEVALSLNVSASASGGSDHKDILEFNYFDPETGQKTHTKHRSIHDKSKQWTTGGSDLPWYNIQALEGLQPNEKVIITEGELDCIAAVQAGFTRVISLPNGATEKLPDHLIEQLDSFVPDDQEIIIASDGDAAGEKCALEIAYRLGRSRCRRVAYPEGQKDLCDSLKCDSEASVQDLIHNSAFVHVAGLYSLDDLPVTKPKTIFDVGIESLPKLKIRKGDFSVITGIPGNGKSSFIVAMTCSLARKQGWRICLASFENDYRNEFVRDAMAWFHAKPVMHQSEEEKGEAQEFVRQHFRFIEPDVDTDVSIEWLYDCMGVAVRREACDMVIIDPWNEIDHDYNEAKTSKTKYVEQVLRELRRFARKMDIHLSIVAHTTKIRASNQDEGEYPVPTLYDIADSANWNNKCDLGIIIHRDKENNALIRLQKCRYGKEIGLSNMLDTVLGFNPHTSQYFVTEASHGLSYE